MSIIEDYNALLNEREAELTKCKARLQVMREWMNHFSFVEWSMFVRDVPEARDWFDEDGVPK